MARCLGLAWRLLTPPGVVAYAYRSCLRAAIGILALPAALLAQTAKAAAPASDAAYIRKAEGGAPSSISKDARIARFDKDGKVNVLRDGSNDFTCASIPQMGIPAYCGDKNAWDWMTSAMSRKDKPSNNEPGIAYRCRRGTLRDR